MQDDIHTFDSFGRAFVSNLSHLAKRKARKSAATVEEVELDLKVLVRFAQPDSSPSPSMRPELPPGHVCCMCVSTEDGLAICLGDCC